MAGMEAAAVKAAVSGMLNLVCNKLAPLVIKEYSSIVGVKKDLQDLQDLAQEINSRLEAAGDRTMGDAPSLKKLKEVLYEVDDVVDEFQMKAEKHEADGDGGFVSKYLSISRLKYDTLPEVISEMWSLQALHVTLSGLVELPESIGKLQKLRVVNLSNCLKLTSLPDSIGNCIKISSIDLFGCEKFATLPSSISRNKRLRALRLGHTILERLPSSITALENLECLDLRWCSKLVELPQGIGNLKKLVVLNYPWNCTLYGPRCWTQGMVEAEDKPTEPDINLYK